MFTDKTVASEVVTNNTDVCNCMHGPIIHVHVHTLSHVFCIEHDSITAVFNGF